MDKAHISGNFSHAQIRLPYFKSDHSFNSVCIAYSDWLLSSMVSRLRSFIVASTREPLGHRLNLGQSYGTKTDQFSQLLKNVRADFLPSEA